MYDQASRKAYLIERGYEPRTTAWRPDLAAASLRGKLEAKRYKDGIRVRCAVPSSSLRFEPDLSSPVEHQLLYGHIFVVYKEESGFSWGQNELDKHVGFVRTSDLQPLKHQTTHWVCSPVANIRSRPNRQVEACLRIPLNSRVSIQSISDEDSIYARLADGRYIFVGDIRRIGDWCIDPVQAIMPFVDYSAYEWGYSDGSFDCSGLTQAGWRSMGINCFRDADQQLKDPRIGGRVNFDPRLINLRPFDQVYWAKHLAIMVNEREAIHAKGDTVRRVVVEPITAIDKWRQETENERVCDVKRL